MNLQEPYLKHVWRNRILYLMLLPGLVHLLLFKIAPLFGLAIAFQDFNMFLGVLESKWVGLKHFIAFVNDPYIPKLLVNTIMLSVYTLVFGFPAPILFALFLNEVRSAFLKRTVQTLTFFPHFIATAVLVSMMYLMFSPQTGLVNVLLQRLGFESIFFFAEPEWFRTLFVSSGIWSSFGYGAVIYLSAMAAIDPHLYEAADMDGANRWHKIFHITLPSIMNTVVIMFILEIGNVLTVNLDKILLMYNPSVFERADVIQSYVYRVAFAGEFGLPKYSYGIAVSLLQSIFAFVLIFLANQAAKKYSESRLF
ncbi:MAG TPA: ABC transporter permease subunit [Paenibacillus sp.]|nr:ABC transporter permease subunit [Paenibacillus sp.]